MTAQPADDYITGGGTIYLFTLLTQQAREWVHEHVSRDHQMLGNGLAVEWRYVTALAAGMEADGLVLTDGEAQS